MDNAASLHTQNVSITTQPLYTQPNVNPAQPNSATLQSYLQGTVLHEPGNEVLVKEMEQEVAVWVTRAITYFITALLSYVNLEYKLPLEALVALPLILDIFMLVFYFNKYRFSITYSIVTRHLY